MRDSQKLVDSKEKIEQRETKILNISVEKNLDNLIEKELNEKLVDLKAHTEILRKLHEDKKRLNIEDRSNDT